MSSSNSSPNSTPNSSPGAKLREAMAGGMVLAPFVYDGFTALIAEGQGAQAVYMTGHGTSAQIGLPDVGLTSMAEMVSNLGYIADAVDVPVIADADTGYGNAINAQRAVREYETAGAAALHLEDQVFPKRCGFFEGKQCVPMAEHVQKIRAAIDARSDPDLVIIARTDAVAPNGWEDAIRRAEAYREAGADVVFVDGVKTAEDMDIYTRRLVEQGLPCLYNGNLLPGPEIAERGFKIMITGGGHALSYAAVCQALVNLKDGGGGEGRDLDQFNTITNLLGLPEIYELEQRYAID
ncbi:MAG: isocitrate lyase/PEP mutase family protein [Rhodospirillaceae bacterium]|jgi:2,3-dimethylmalate lyase|nr:isocitrate lyase/PEP mutase family protein [Rhodospirillaceae bacterium]MBT3493036.1 isocitrate lyase/PEP mutase family protein [Rhodospirillaceae bacterium]MBT3782237.1 isocitrate lyase/PEP mutase family protein [Rhodospirillaceae bacterium]MBT3977756.1 isocitrate lyase/PEP mutase family protein [Rhodospirillaceae bacterium]MBT4168626.1 isocitrate lyase/PEP mutase family protein [Rhodospirillaceae bacterium]